MSIDMDPDNTPANTATSLGSLQSCARIDENGVLDADEDTTEDTVTVDVTITNIPDTNPMIGFTYVLNYSEPSLTVQTADHNYLLAANGIVAFPVSDPVPDTDNSDTWTGQHIDLGTDPPEFGSGVLSRLTISSDSTALMGDYPLTLTEAAIIDPANDTQVPDSFNFASIAINQPCAAPAVASGFLQYVSDLYSALVYLSRLGR